MESPKLKNLYNKNSLLYNKIAPIYDSLLSFIFNIFCFNEYDFRIKMLQKLAKYPIGIPLVDLGCGTGRNFLPIRSILGNRRIYGIDASNRMLEIAYKRIKKENIDNIYLVNNNLSNWREINSLVGNEYLVVSSFTLSVIWNEKRALEGYLLLCRNAIDFSIMDGYWGIESIKRHMVRFLSIFFGIDHSYWSHSTGERIVEYIHVEPILCFQNLLCYI